MNRFDDIVLHELPYHLLHEECQEWTDGLQLGVALVSACGMWGPMLVHEGKEVAELSRDLDDLGWELSWRVGGKRKRAAVKALRQAIDERSDYQAHIAAQAADLYVDAYNDLLTAVRRRLAKLNVGRGIQGAYRMLTPVPEPVEFFTLGHAATVCLNGVVVWDATCTDGYGYELLVRSEGDAFADVVTGFHLTHQRIFQQVV